ncbi:MAG TPA: hypothetical protein VGM17_18915 [Rhizomicrobium sp.]|jgi:hypothetical protein
MRRSARVKQLAEIAGIREVQRTRSEADAMRAAADRALAELALSERRQQSQSVEDKWLASVTANSFSPELANLWASHAREAQAAVRKAAVEADRAGEELELRTSSFDRATARHDLAREAKRKAARKDTQKIEDAVLQDALDRHGQRRRVG